MKVLLHPRALFRAIASTRVVLGQLVLSQLLIGQLLTSPAWSKDPFRSVNPRPIGPQTEATFEALFKDGNYKQAQTSLESAIKAEPTDPLLYSLRAVLAYTQEDVAGLGTYAAKTQEVAEQLVKTDPLRGNLYIGVGHFLKGAHAVATQGKVRGLSEALRQLQKTLQHLDEAEKIDPKDPELNLVRGYMDLFLAQALPFADTAEAIERLQQKAAPSYLMYRGIALGYLDLEQFEQALDAVDKAIALTPNNPDLFYLKGQIYIERKQDQEGVKWLKKALKQQEQLLPFLAKQLRYETCRAENRIDKSNRDCRAILKGV